MWFIYRGGKLLQAMDNYRSASNYCRKHRGCKPVWKDIQA